MSKSPKVKKPLTEEQKITRRTLLSFGVLIGLDLLAFGAWKRLRKDKYVDGVQGTLRKGLETNERVFGSTFSNGRLAKEYPIEAAAKKVRVNGHVGLKSEMADNPLIQIVRNANDVVTVTLKDLKQLPKTEVIYDFKCVEGWSQVSHWGGVKFSDFMKHYNLTAQAAMNYVGLETPDKEYYVGIDMKSALHPQTLLAYEVNGKQLPLEHGYPLRLIIPTKYGIKNLKRIGTIFFSNDKPADYWAKLGYDYYSGL